MQLIQLNVESVNGNLRFVGKESYAATITPALSVVVFSMLGFFTNLVAGGWGEVESAALYAAHQAIVEKWNKHRAAFDATQKEKPYERGRKTLSVFLADLENTGTKRQYDNEISGLERSFGNALKEARLYRL